MTYSDRFTFRQAALMTMAVLPLTAAVLFGTFALMGFVS